MILSIISVLAMAYQLATGVHIPEDLINQLAFWIGNGIALGLSIYGVIKSHKKA
jgi:hypothetical protein